MNENETKGNGCYAFIFSILIRRLTSYCLIARDIRDKVVDSIVAPTAVPAYLRRSALLTTHDKDDKNVKAKYYGNNIIMRSEQMTEKNTDWMRKRCMNINGSSNKNIYMCMSVERACVRVCLVQYTCSLNSKLIVFVCIAKMPCIIH